MSEIQAPPRYCYTSLTSMTSAHLGHTTRRPFLLVNIGQLLTLRIEGKSGPRRGTELSELKIIEDAAVLCARGRIISVGKTKDALRDPWVRKNRKKLFEIDCTDKVVLPGFVDSHTHPAFISPRLVDFEKRIAGASYEEIAEAGGGIRSSLADVRKAGKKVLAEKIFQSLDEMASSGTTTVEAKSGYGLSLESEIKSLEAIRNAARHWPGTVVPTLLAAHVVPPEFEDRRENYIDLICEEMIPLATKRKLARFVDVFVERGAFSIKEAGRIFRVARTHGLGIRAHVCQLSAESLGALLEFHPRSLDHLDYVRDADIAKLAARDTIATLVPAANFFLGTHRFPPTRKLIDEGVPVALATDYNPGTAPTTSMPFILSLACTQMKMSAAEAIGAATINGAWALDLADRKGSIENGKDADLIVFDVKDYREIPYWLASNNVAFTVVNGVMKETQNSSR